jgi:hypothetical protein
MRNIEEEVKIIVPDKESVNWEEYVKSYHRAMGESSEHDKIVLDKVNEVLLDNGVLAITDGGYIPEKDGTPSRIFGSILGRTIRLTNENDAKALTNKLGEGYSYSLLPTS